MDRQRLILLCGLALACRDDATPMGSFDGPMAAAVLPAEGTVFEEPVGFIANSRSGIIVPLDLKHGTMLADQFAAPFMRPRWIATGSSRILGDIVAYAPTEDTVSLLAADTAHGVLLEVPYMVGFDGEPEVVTPTYGAPEFIDVDGSGDAPSLTEIALRRGWSTTEDWVVEFDGEVWVTTGSRSGRQPQTVSGSGHFQAQNRELEFDIKGAATRGDRFEFSTHTGIVEHDLGGMVLALERVPGQRMVVAAVWTPETEVGSVVLWSTTPPWSSTTRLAAAGRPSTRQHRSWTWPTSPTHPTRTCWTPRPPSETPGTSTTPRASSGTIVTSSWPLRASTGSTSTTLMWTAGSM
jgi:hypothetical protein